MPPEQPTSPNSTSANNDQNTQGGYQPTPEEIERTKKVMRDSLAARKPKGFLESLKEWFR